jgi:hypothetical protein
MKQIILLTFLTIAFVQFASSQNTIAKLKFEDAEQAYANNNFEQALSNLIEVETLLKSTNPKILFLKINSQSKIIEKNPLDDYTLIENAKKLSSQYLIDYENLPDNEDKYREIYKISESLKKFFPTLEDFNKQKNQIELEKREKEQVIKNTIKKYDDNFMDFLYFEYKVGLSVSDTKKEYPELVLKYIKNNGQSGASEELVSLKKNFRFYVKNDKVLGYLGEISSGSFETGSFDSEDVEFSKNKQKIDDIKNILITKFNFSPLMEIHSANNYGYEKNNISYSWIKNGKTIRLDISYKKKVTMMSAFYLSTISIYSIDNSLVK